MAKSTRKPKPAQRTYWVPRPEKNSGKKPSVQDNLKQRLNLDERNIKLLAFTLFIVCLVAFATVMDDYLNPHSKQVCVDMCGDGVCNEVVWQGADQPCPESSYNCIQDCPEIEEIPETPIVVPTEEVLSADEKARGLAINYVQKLHCYNTYSGFNLMETGFTKVSDEGYGTYLAQYAFDVDRSLLPENASNVTGFTVDLTISNNFVSGAKVNEIFGGSQSAFCGYSTAQYCASDGECFSGGCSGQICQSIYEESIITTCEWMDCYSAAAYGLSCGCVNNQCIWR